MQTVQKSSQAGKKSNASSSGQDWSRWRINTGPLMAGVIGRRKFAYDIWGDTVNGDEV